MMNISAKETGVSIKIGSAEGTRKSDLIWEKNGYNVNSPSLISFRHTHGVYIYHLKLVSSIVLRALAVGLLVKPMNAT